MSYKYGMCKCCCAMAKSGAKNRHASMFVFVRAWHVLTAAIKTRCRRQCGCQESHQSLPTGNTNNKPNGKRKKGKYNKCNNK